MIANATSVAHLRGRPAVAGRGLQAAAVATQLIAVAARNGGYFPTSWGWSALFFGWCAVVALVLVRDGVLSIPAVLLALALVAFAAWTLLSCVWSDATSAAVLDGERALVYAAAIGALMLLARAILARVLLAGLLVAFTGVSLYALATRLFPSSVGSYDAVAGVRLSAPLGYWNGLGLFSALGALLAFGFATRGRGFAARAVGGATLVVLLPTMYFTFSRGAWAALALGLVALLVLDAHRLQVCISLLVAAVAPTIAVFASSRASGLTTLGIPLAHARHDGHRLFVVLVALAIVGAALCGGLEVAARRVAVGATVRRGFAAVIVAVLVALFGLAVAHWGAPWHMASRGWQSFTSSPTNAVSGQHLKAGTNLNGRLFQLSNNNRIVSWKAAVHEWRSAPFAGTGAGTFEDWWDAHRPAQSQIRNAHSLYLETMGTLGIVGLLLLLGVIITPLVAAVRARREPLVPFAAAAFVAWAVHAGVDWDWQIPAVTLPALACAAVVCNAAPGRTFTLGTKARVVIGTAAAAIAVFGLVAGIGNQALADANKALTGQNYAKADQQAKKAATWNPWLSEPWIIRGEIAAYGADATTAKRDFRTAIAKDPHNYLAWYGLAGVTNGKARREAVAKVEALNPLSDEAKELRAGS